MELVFEPQILNKEPEQKLEIAGSLGLLNSKYKCVANESLTTASVKSIFCTRRLIKNRRYHFASSAEVLLKVVTFLVVIVVVFA